MAKPHFEEDHWQNPYKEQTMSDALLSAREIHGPYTQLLTNLQGPNGHEWLEELKHFNRKESCWVNRGNTNDTLCKLADNLTLPATTGTRTIGKAKKIFSGYLDDDFVNWGLDVPSSPTPVTSVAVYEQRKDATLAAIFGSVGKNLDDLCFTQGQIISFVEVHPQLLHRQGYGAFFLFKVSGAYFVAHVYRGSAGRLRAHVRRLAHDCVWYAEYRYRFVMPQLATSPT